MKCVLIFCFVIACISGASIPEVEDVVPNAVNLEEGSHFQGDVDISEKQLKYMRGSKKLSKTGLVNSKYRWNKNALGQVVVPYYLEPSSPYTPYDKDLIQLSMNEIELNTCIKFVPRTYEYDFIHIWSGGDCSSAVGRQGGRQLVSLTTNEGAGATCMIKGTIMHEFMHALGFLHMQAHPDRDYYVKVNYENIKYGMEFAFAKEEANVINNFGTPYDLNSIMHYVRNAFSRNSAYTIVPYDSSYLKTIGQRVRLSPGDITRIKNMYRC